MKTLRWALTGWLAVVAVPLALAAKEPAISYNGKPGPYGVETASYDWRDKTRESEVPVKIYYPRTGAGRFPVIIFSHGLGGSREGYEYLGRHWASYGYVSVHLQHKGSDTEVWKGQATRWRRCAERADRPTLNRPKDVSFAIDQMEKLNSDKGRSHGRLDLERVGVAGHSFGAYTTLAVIGEDFAGPAAGRSPWPIPRPGRHPHERPGARATDHWTRPSARSRSPACT